MSHPTQSHLRFHFERACQAVAFLLRELHGSRMNYMRMLKLLYIAERESLKESGQGIVGGKVVAMQRGPVLEAVYDLIRGQHFCTPDWSKYFHNDGYHLVMHSDPGVGKLNRFITSKLTDVAHRFRDQDEWAMVDFTHKNIAEWQKNDPGQSSKSIPLADILGALGIEGEMSRILEFDCERAAIAADSDFS